jgi:glycosyltransferase involved in cell wall biosynthesis
MEPHADTRAVMAFGFSEFGRPRRAPRTRDMLFVGGFRHPPNEQAVLWFVAQVLPLVRRRIDGARLLVVGSHPSPRLLALAGPHIVVRADISAAELCRQYALARVVVAPLRCGAGVKLKVVEALREGVPLVTTSVGAQGMPELERVASVAADAADFADEVVRLLSDDALWAQRCAAQIGYARERFSEAALRESFLAAIGMEPGASAMAAGA